MTLSALFEQIDVPLADTDAARAARAFRRPRPGRPRLRAAPAARQLAVDAGGHRRRRAHHVEGRARGRRPRRGAARRLRLARLRRLVGRAARAGDRAERVADRRRRRRRRCSTCRPRSGCRRRCASSASTSRGCPTPSGTPDPWPPHGTRRPAEPGTVLAFDFGDAPDRGGDGQPGDARRASADDHRRRGGTRRASPPSVRSSTNGGPSALVVGRPVHMDGTAHGMTARAERFARQLEGRFGLPVTQRRRAADDAGAPRRRSREAGVTGREAPGGARRSRGAAHPAGLVRRRPATQDGAAACRLPAAA